MRVAHLIPTLKKGGAERFALDVTIAQREQLGAENALLLVMEGQDEYNDYSHLARPQHVNSRYLPSISGRSLLEIDGYRDAVRRFEPDVIHTHLFGAELLSSAWIQPGALYVTHCHDNMRQFGRPSLRMLSKRALTDYFERSLVLWKKHRRVRSFFIANSEDTRQYFRRVLPSSLKNRVLLVPYGFDFNRFFAGPRSLPEPTSRRPLNLTMVASFLEMKKNQEFLVDVVAHLKKRGVSSRLNFVGEGPRRARVEAYARQEGVHGEIRFWGLVSDVEELLWTSDVYVHSATYEPFGLVLLEAMAAGLPCVALDGRGNRDLIHDGANGFLVKEPNPDAFATCVLAAVADAPTYERLSRAAVATAADFRIETCAQKLISLYSDGMAGHGKGGRVRRPGDP